MHIQAHITQKQNPTTRLIKSKVEYTITDSIDFLLGDEGNIRLNFLVFKWHLANQQYVTSRMHKNSFLLLLVDADDNVALRKLNELAFRNNVRLLLAFSFEETAKVIDTLHLLSPARAAEICRGLGGSDDFDAKIRDVLTTVKGVNSTDVGNLLKNFKSLKNIANAKVEELVQIPFIGEKKAQAIYRAFNDPLVS
jgi:ERCC4-type nuclease